MKTPERLALFLAGFLLAVGLVLNLNVVVAQGRMTSVDNPNVGPMTGPASPDFVFSMQMTYQGRLTNASSTPINSPVSMVFKVYDDNDTLLWTSATRAVTPTNGLFTVHLPDDPDTSFLTQNGMASIASIGVTVDGDAEMTPRQSVKTVVGHGLNTGVGVIGGSPNGTGVFGYSSENGTGVSAVNSSTTKPALSANNSGDGPALKILNGYIGVSSSYEGSSTPVFTHQVVTGSSGNICSDQAYSTVINNRFTNNDSDAILIVTPNYGPRSGGMAPAVGIPAVYYDANGDCGKGTGRWVIYNLNSQPQVNNSNFNVMVIKP